MKIMKRCICDKCRAEILIDIKEEFLEDKRDNPVTEQFFSCLKCGTRYTICIYDNYMRKRIEDRKKLSKNKYDSKRSRKLKKEIQNHFQELKIKYGK